MRGTVNIANVQTRRIGLAHTSVVIGGQPLTNEWTAQIRLDRTPPCSHAPAQTWFVLDGSGSLTAHGGNDPLGRRFDEAELALRTLTKCRCGQELAGIVHFDPGKDDRGPIALKPAGKSLSDLVEGLVVPDRGTGSRLGPALDRVETLIAANPTHKANVVVLSDFELFDQNIASVLGRLAGLGTGHAVVLNNAVPSSVVSTPGLNRTHIRFDSAPGEVAKAILDALCTRRGQPPTNPGKGGPPSPLRIAARALRRVS